MVLFSFWNRHPETVLYTYHQPSPAGRGDPGQIQLSVGTFRGFAQSQFYPADGGNEGGLVSVQLSLATRRKQETS